MKYYLDSYEEARIWVDKEVEDFKKRNHVRNENTDRAFMQFKDHLHKCLNAQSLDYMRCKICKEKDHEGQSCRCEDRNIRISKERRARGESPWQPNENLVQLDKEENEHQMRIESQNVLMNVKLVDKEKND